MEIHKIEIKEPQLVTKGRLNKMCKYFRNKDVVITYNYNNSMGAQYDRKYTGKFDNFEVVAHDYASGTEYTVNFHKGDKVVFEQHFGYWAEFTGLGEIKECNDGPYCYFSINKKKSLWQKLK